MKTAIALAWSVVLCLWGSGALLAATDPISTSSPPVAGVVPPPAAPAQRADAMKAYDPDKNWLLSPD